MEDQYGLAGDPHYRQLTAAAQPMFPLADSGHLMMGYHHGHHHHHHHQGFHHHHHHHDLSSEIGGVWSNSNVNTIGTINNVAVEINSCNNGNNNIISGAEVSNNSRWPRQETLTLLEIRSRLNSRFKDSNQKAPLWDEVSRIMAEEHGYQRSGKKCKEKFENLYKYYKKTKEGKAGRQDGKHYRFFRQLEAIYGDQSNNIQSSPTLMETQYLGRNSLLYDHQSTTPSATINRPTNITNNHESLSFSINSTEFETSSSENNEDDLSAIAFKMNNNRISRVDDRKMKGVIDRHAGRDGNKISSSSWKAKVENFVDSQMKKIMTTQETWMEKMLKSIMDKEEERLAKEEEWRKQEAARLDQEVGEFWAKEKAWVEARDAALVGALKKIRGKDQSLLDLPSFPERMIARDHIRNVDAKSGNSYSTTSYHRWSEEEISSLIELRTGLEPPPMFEGTSTNVLYSGVNYKEGINWEEIASKMACLGYCRSANECKEKWESVSVYVTMTSELKKKRREDYYKITSGCYFDGQELEPKQDNHHHHHHHGSNNNNNNNNAMGLQLMMDHEGIDNSPSSSNVATQIHPNNFFHLLFGEGENLWDKYGTLRLGKDKNFNQ